MSKNKRPFWPCLLGTVFVISSVLAFAGEPKVKKQDPAIFFWFHFRSAVTGGNLPKLQNLTLFPFEMENAEGRVTKTSRASFVVLYRPLLDTPGENGKTMRDLITEKEDLTIDERTALKEGEIKIGSFRFRTIKNKCYFVGATLHSEPSAAKESPPPEPPSPPHPVIEEATGAELVNLAASTPRSNPTGKTTSSQPGPKTPVVEPTESSPQNTVFRFFWIEFRRAAMENDVPKIKSLTRFPFETKGPLEDDRTKKVVSREFDLLWPRLLETDPHSWGPLRDSMKELIGRREEPSVEEISTEPKGQVQVGVFVFRKIKNRWLFTRAIIAE